MDTQHSFFPLLDSFFYFIFFSFRIFSFRTAIIRVYLLLYLVPVLDGSFLLSSSIIHSTLGKVYRTKFFVLDMLTKTTENVTAVFMSFSSCFPCFIYLIS